MVQIPATILLSARISEEVKHEMDVHCVNEGIKIQYFVETAIKEKLQKDSK